ncbi:hypothetical protein KM043_001859 [Ampulex compressa]|nr:hypothetical protein KM043_001859 [Ampulex compressa]
MPGFAKYSAEPARDEIPAYESLRASFLSLSTPANDARDGPASTNSRLSVASEPRPEFPSKPSRIYEGNADAPDRAANDRRVPTDGINLPFVETAETERNCAHRDSFRQISCALKLFCTVPLTCAVCVVGREQRETDDFVRVGSRF